MKEKKKKKSILKRLMPYGGKKRGLLYVAMVLSAISGVAVLMPMVFIHRIVRNLILSGTADLTFIKENAAAEGRADEKILRGKKPIQVQER